MKCKFCGHEVDGSKTNCPFCGARFISDETDVRNARRTAEMSWNTMDFPKPKGMEEIEISWPEFSSGKHDANSRDNTISNIKWDDTPNLTPDEAKFFGEFAGTPAQADDSKGLPRGYTQTFIPVGFYKTTPDNTASAPAPAAPTVNANIGSTAPTDPSSQRLTPTFTPLQPAEPVYKPAPAAYTTQPAEPAAPQYTQPAPEAKPAAPDFPVFKPVQFDIPKSEPVYNPAPAPVYEPAPTAYTAQPAEPEKPAFTAAPAAPEAVAEPEYKSAASFVNYEPTGNPALSAEVKPASDEKGLPLDYTQTFRPMGLMTSDILPPEAAKWVTPAAKEAEPAAPASVIAAFEAELAAYTSAAAQEVKASPAEPEKPAFTAAPQFTQPAAEVQPVESQVQQPAPGAQPAAWTPEPVKQPEAEGLFSQAGQNDDEIPDLFSEPLQNEFLQMFTPAPKYEAKEPEAQPAAAATPEESQGWQPVAPQSAAWNPEPAKQSVSDETVHFYRPQASSPDKEPQKFYTFQRKNEEFQMLLDQEYERIRAMNEGRTDTPAPAARPFAANISQDPQGMSAFEKMLMNDAPAPAVNAFTAPQKAYPEAAAQKLAEAPLTAEMLAAEPARYSIEEIEKTIRDLEAQKPADEQANSERRRKLAAMAAAREAYFRILDEENGVTDAMPINYKEPAPAAKPVEPPVQPAVQKPAEPVIQESAEPEAPKQPEKVEIPVQPAAPVEQKPAEPIAAQPSEQVIPRPAESEKTAEPVQPAEPERPVQRESLSESVDSWKASMEAAILALEAQAAKIMVGNDSYAGLAEELKNQPDIPVQPEIRNTAAQVTSQVTEQKPVEPVQPAEQKPVEPIAAQPAEQVIPQPAEPAAPKAAEPVIQQPASTEEISGGSLDELLTQLTMQSEALKAKNKAFLGEEEAPKPKTTQPSGSSAFDEAFARLENSRTAVFAAPEDAKVLEVEIHSGQPFAKPEEPAETVQPTTETAAEPHPSETGNNQPETVEISTQPEKAPEKEKTAEERLEELLKTASMLQLWQSENAAADKTAADADATQIAAETTAATANNTAESASKSQAAAAQSQAVEATPKAAATQPQPAETQAQTAAEPLNPAAVAPAAPSPENLPEEVNEPTTKYVPLETPTLLPEDYPEDPEDSKEEDDEEEAGSRFIVLKILGIIILIIALLEGSVLGLRRFAPDAKITETATQIEGAVIDAATSFGQKIRDGVDIVINMIGGGGSDER